jgi:predicted TPR repeat methyltransferase
MAYLSATAAAAGFETVAIISTTLRLEAGAPVSGFLAIYRRAD